MRLIAIASLICAAFVGFFFFLNRDEDFSVEEKGLSTPKFYRDPIACGETCSYDETRSSPGLLFPIVRKNVNCGNILRRLNASRPARLWPPPQVKTQREEEYSVFKSFSCSTSSLFRRTWKNDSP